MYYWWLSCLLVCNSLAPSKRQDHFALQLPKMCLVCKFPLINSTIYQTGVAVSSVLPCPLLIEVDFQSQDLSLSLHVLSLQIVLPSSSCTDSYSQGKRGHNKIEMVYILTRISGKCIVWIMTQINEKGILLQFPSNLQLHTYYLLWWSWLLLCLLFMPSTNS